MSRIDPALAWIQSWDERVCLRFNRALHYRVMPGMLRMISRLGDGVLWYSLMLAMLLAFDHAAVPVAHMLVAGMACTATYKLLKRGTLRPRPCQVHRSIAAGMPPLDQFSFPSGHTLHAVAFTLIATVHYPWLAIALVPFTLATGVSRVMLGLHYPSDVLAGAILGASIAALSFLAL